MDEALQAIAIRPEDTRRYRDLENAKTIEGAIRGIERLDHDLDALRKLGDELAVRGATALLNRAVVDMVAIPARTIQESERKMMCLCAHQRYIDPDWLLGPMVGTSIRLDWLLLGLDDEQEARLRRMFFQRPEAG